MKHDDITTAQDNGIHRNELPPTCYKIHSNYSPDFSNRGGIVGRGILLDYVSWAERKGIKFDAFTRHEIHVSDLEEIAREEGIEFRHGDIMIIRSGWIKHYDEQPLEKMLIDNVHDGVPGVGLAGCEETIEWLWNHHFSVIAGDTMSYEAWPPNPPWSKFLSAPHPCKCKPVKAPL